MPSVSYCYGGFYTQPYAYVPFIYNRKPMILVLDILNVCGLIDLSEKTFASITGHEDNGKYARIVDFNLSGSKVKSRIFYGHIGNDSWRLADIEVDLSALTASRTLIAEKTSSDDADITYLVKKGQVLSQRTILVAEGDKPYIWSVDAKDLSIISKYDTGFGEYNPRLSHQIVIKPDDIYMLIGEHLDSANFYKYAVYSETLTSISGSNPQSSPNPMICNMFVSHKTRLLTGGANTIAGHNNLLCWFDDDFNLLAKTDLSSIYSTPYPEGLVIVGKKSNGNLVLVGLIANAHLIEVTANSLVYLEIDSSNYSLASYQKLQEFTDMNNAPYVLGTCLGTDSDRLGLPVIDVRSKKVYMTAWWKVGGDNRLGLVEFDLSDVDIVEWNQHAWFLNKTTIPTFLSLNVIPQ
ncbi:MAG: hypothetical protein DRJ03_16715 [Chloroflexi bacterium]|nr:MAG: hypothetical protein DRJ03_16715 [Chloroflexota bacterium]